MDQCRTTFILPYYRGIEYLKITMDSLVEQTEGKWNAIVLDDRGGDDAEELEAFTRRQKWQQSRQQRRVERG